jgi:hypothetical protein
MRSPWKRRWERPNWGLVLATIAVGSAISLSARWIKDEFYQNLLVGIGSSVMTFALLALAEPWLVRQLRSPRDLAEATSRLRQHLDPFATGEGNPPTGVTVPSLVNRSTDAVLHRLRDAGFRPEYTPSTSAHMTLAAPANLNLTWTIDWSGNRLRHTVRRCGGSPDRQRHSGLRHFVRRHFVRRHFVWRSADSLPEWESEELTPESIEHALSQVHEFESRVFPIMTWILDDLDRRAPRR